MTVVLDTSGWIELLSGTSRAELYQPALHADRLIVPVLVRHEVARYTLANGGEAARELALSALAKFEQMNMDASMADAASTLAHRYKLAMADSLVYAAAQSVEAELWTQDRHFEQLPNVRFFPKK